MTTPSSAGSSSIYFGVDIGGTGIKALVLDSAGNPLTEQGKLTERFRRPTFGLMQVEITVNDPKAYTKPWTVTIDQPLVLDSELIDYYCLENEKDFVHMKTQDQPITGAGGVQR